MSYSKVTFRIHLKFVLFVTSLLNELISGTVTVASYGYVNGDPHHPQYSYIIAAPQNVSAPPSTGTMLTNAGQVGGIPASHQHHHAPPPPSVQQQQQQQSYAGIEFSTAPPMAAPATYLTSNSTGGMVGSASGQQGAPPAGQYGGYVSGGGAVAGSAVDTAVQTGVASLLSLHVRPTHGSRCTSGVCLPAAHQCPQTVLILTEFT